MKNIRFTFIIIVLIAYSCTIPKQEQEKLTKYVNPFIGTDGPGNTYPGATVPFEMVQLSPDIGISGWDRISGYYYQDSIISGFSHTHLSGTGAGDLYDILVMPTNSKFLKRIKENNFKPFSGFSHEKEKASPGYYTVELLDYKIKAELAATARTGIQRYTFPKDSLTQIHIDLGYALNWDGPTKIYLKVMNDSTIEGFRKSTGWAKDQRVYFVMKFSKAFKSYKLFRNDSLTTSPVIGKNIRIILNYTTKEGEQIVLKTGLSSANIKGAYKSLEIEAPDFNFDVYKYKADSIWERQLHKIEIRTSDENKKNIFYTT